MNPSQRLHILVTLAVALILATTGCSERGTDATPADPLQESGAGAGSRQPSLILIVIDTLRRDRLTFHGYDRPTSPALAALAKESIVFDNCLAASSWTQPSMVSLLTGLYPTRHRAHETIKVDPAIVFLAEELQQAGYQTGGISGNPNVSKLFNMDQGFDHFEFMGTMRASQYADLTELVGAAEEWLTVVERDRPFFLYLHVMNVHGPYVAGDEFRAPFRETPYRELAFQSKLWMDIINGKVERRSDVTEQHLRDLNARYDGAIAWTDHVLGAFLDRLRQQEILDDSWLVVTSDHGEELFDHGGFGHGRTLLEEVVRVPLILREPGQGRETGRRIDAPVSLVDLPATLLELFGLLPEEAGGRFGDGTSLVPLLHSPEAEVPERLILSELIRQTKRRERGNLHAVQRWPWMLIEVERDYAGREGVVELFRLDEDPTQSRNRFEEEPAIGGELLRRGRELRAALAAVGFEATPAELTDEQRKGLEALGYFQH